MTLDSAKIDMELDHIVEVVDLMDDTLKFHISMQYTVMFGIFAIVGTALYFLAKTWFENITKKRIDTKFINLKDEQTKELNQLESRIKTREWISPTLLSGHSTIEDERLSYFKNTVSNTVYFRGALKHSGMIDTPTFYIPPGFRPPQNVTFDLLIGEYPHFRYAKMVIFPDGRVTIKARRDDIIYLNNVYFFLDDSQVDQ